MAAHDDAVQAFGAAQLSIRIDPELRRAIDELAAENFRTTTQEVQLALSRWVDPEAVRDRRGGQ